ncbi:MAG: serine/threonine-protein kinase [Myxococcota bacterium]
MTNPANFTPGSVFDERFAIEGPLGKGGWSFVYRAVHQPSGRACALKMLDADKAEDEAFVEKFLAEASVLEKLTGHPHIVELLGSGITDGGIAYVATELIDGASMTRFIADHAPCTWGVTQRLINQIASGLDHAHQKKIIHRDLKPGNVLIAGQQSTMWTAKLLDFGIAKVVQQMMGESVTRVGTPVYCAPEQLGSSMREAAEQKGVTIAAHLSPATDVWPLALISFELLTGMKAKKYWGARDLASVMLKATMMDRVPPSEMAGDRSNLLPPGFDDWFMRCIRRNAAERYQRAGDAAGELSELLEGFADEPTMVRPAAQKPRKPPPPRSSVGGAGPVSSGSSLPRLDASDLEEEKRAFAAPPAPQSTPSASNKTGSSMGPSLEELLEREKEQNKKLAIGVAIFIVLALVVYLVT